MVRPVLAPHVAPPERLLLAGITLYALLVPLMLALRWPMGFDEGWHVLFAELPIGRAIGEFRLDAHPPLSYLLLRPLAALGVTPVWPRLLSVLPSAVQPWLLFLLVRRLGVGGPVAIVTAFVFAVSFSFAEVSVPVRAYSLATLFVLLSLISWVDFVRSGAPSAAWRFTIFSVLAVWTEYPSAFVSAALLTSTALLAARAPRLRSRVFSPRIARPALAFAAGHLGALVYWATTYGRGGLPHLDPWFLQPGSSWTGFLAGGSLSILRTFTPLGFGADSLGYTALLVLCVGWGAIFAASRGGEDGTLRRTILLTLALVWITLFALGVAGAYPFGGLPRQQYVLFPLLIVTGAIGLDRALATLPWGMRLAVLAFVPLVAVGTAALSFQRHPVAERSLWVEIGPSLFDAKDRDRPLLLGNYAFIGLYGGHRSLGWRYVGTVRGELERFEVGGENPWTVYRHRGSWMVPPVGNPGFYDAARVILEETSADTLLAFTPRQGAEPFERRRARGTKVARAYARAGLEVESWRPIWDGEILELAPRRGVAR